MKYQKKPVIVDAVQFKGRMRELYDFREEIYHLEFLPENNIKLVMCRGEILTMKPTDWPLKDENGNFFPEEDERFKRDYEPIK